MFLFILWYSQILKLLHWKSFLPFLLHLNFWQFQGLNVSSNTTNALECIKMLKSGCWYYPFNFALQNYISSEKIFLLFRWSFLLSPAGKACQLRWGKNKSAPTYIMFHGEMKCNFGNRFDIWDFPVLERQNLLQTWKCSVRASGGSCAQFSKAPLAADNGELLAVFREADAYLCSYSVQSWLDDKVRRRTSHHRVGAIGSWYPAGEG